MDGDDLIEISVQSGRSGRPTVTFTPGTPADPLSVGTAGKWNVMAEGVGPIHLYIAFDGETLHVAAAAKNLPTLLAGAPIGTDWTKATLPCELRFGSACLILRMKSAGDLARAAEPSQEENTVHDGGALREAALRAAAATTPSGRPPLGSKFPPARPAAGGIAPGALKAPRVPQIAPIAGFAKPQGDTPPIRERRAGSAASIPPVRAPSVGPPAPPAPVAASARRPASAPSDAPATARAQPSTEPPANPPPAAPPHGGPAAPSATGVVSPAGATPPRPGVVEQAAPVAAAIAERGSGAARTTAGAPAASRPFDEAKTYWREASWVKKVTLVLMPFALVLSYLMMQDEEPAPPRRPAASGARADAGAPEATATRDADAASATTAGTASPLGSALAVPPAVAGAGAPSSAVPPKPTALPAGKRTPERQALDTAAAGSFDEAARLYDALAGAHPDDPSYREAARILREKAAQ